MKKLYFLLIALITTSISIGQNIAVNGGFESWTGGVVDSWTSESGTTLTEETTIVTEGTSAINFEVTTGTQGDTDFRQSVPVSSGVVYDVSVKVYQVDSFSRARLYADGYQGYSDETQTGVWQTVSYVYTATSTGNVDFGLRFYDTAGFSGSSTIIADDFQIVAQAGPSLTVTSPADGALIYSPDVNVEISVQNFVVANGTGDGHIHYTVDGGSVIIKYDTNPIALTGLSAGSHTVDLELVDNSHSSLTPPITASVTFSVVQTQTLPTSDSFDYTATETLAAQAPWTNYFSGDDILIESGSLSYSTLMGQGNSVSFDGSGADAVVDYTPTSSGKIYASFMFKVTAFDASAVNGYFAVLRTNGGSYESRLWISPVTATTYSIGISNGGTLTQVNSTVHNLNDVVFVVFNYDIDNDMVNAWINPSLGGSEPAADISEASTSTGNTFSQFMIRQDSTTETPFIVMDELRGGTSWTDVTPATLGVSQLNSNNFKIYPNPTNTGFVNLTTANSGDIYARVFDILGKQVLSRKVENNLLDISNLNSGMYILRLSQDNATVSKKLIIE